MRKKGGAKLLWAVILAVCFVPGSASSDVATVDSVYVTDVTTRSFSVIWTASEGATASLEVGQSYDANGVIIGDPTAVITPHPTNCDPGLKPVAEDLGVMKVRVAGLDADTTYYFRTLTTSKSTSDLTVFPEDIDPPLPVTTESLTVRTTATNQPFSNDIMISDWTMADGLTPADGSLVFASVTGGSSPVTTFVGDCAPAGSALVDLNNVFDAATGKNFDLNQGINLNLVNFRGGDGLTQIVHETPVDNSLAEIKIPDPGLKPGWNMFASQVEPADSQASSVLAPIGPPGGSLISVWEYNGVSWDTYDPNFPPMFNTLQNINGIAGYWINVAGSESLPILESYPSVQPNVSLSAGWNMVGIPFFESVGARVFVNEVKGPGNVVTIWSWNSNTSQWDTFNPLFPDQFNTLQVVEPGKSYWVQMDGGCGNALCQI